MAVVRGETPEAPAKKGDIARNGEIPVLSSIDAAAVMATTRDPGAVHASVPVRLIVVAWIIEVVVILIGFMLALFAGLEHAPAGFLPAASAAAPFAAGAVVEISRIPLVEGAFSVQGRLWPTIAATLVLLFGALTFNNLLFGFERAFNLRIEQVREAEQRVTNRQATVDNQERRIRELESQRDELDRQLTNLRSDAGGAQVRAAGDIDSAGKDIEQIRAFENARLEAIEREREAMLKRQEKERNEAYAACRRTDQRCTLTAVANRHRRELALLDKLQKDQQAVMDSRIDAIGRSRDEARKERNASIARVDDRIRETDAALQTVRAQIAATETQLSSSRSDLGDAEAEVVGARRDSQMHRLAKVVFGREDDGSAQRMLGWFAAIAAGVLAMAGSGLAAVYYRAKMKNPVELEAARMRHEKLGLALRGLVYRLRGLAARS